MKAYDDNSPMRWILASRETGSMKEMFEPAPKKTDKPLVESGKKQEIYFDKTAVVKKSGKEAEPEARAVKDPNVPYLQSLRGDNYFIWEYQGRLYVVGSPETGEYFQKEKQLPAAKTILNAGPNGETVVFEADENDPFLAARLVEEFIYGEPEDAREKEPEKNSVQSKTADNDSPEAPVPYLVDSSDNDYFVWASKNKLFIVGKKASNERFEKEKTLLLYKTVQNGGPNGETLIFEADENDPLLGNRLAHKFFSDTYDRLRDEKNIIRDAPDISKPDEKSEKKEIEYYHLEKAGMGTAPGSSSGSGWVWGEPNLLVSNNKDYFVWEYDDRLYVIGNKSTSESFAKERSLPLTKTVLGAGPEGETVVFEISKSDDGLTDRLVERFVYGPHLLEFRRDYYVWRYKNELYVIGNPETSAAFEKYFCLVESKSVPKAGPNGEMVFFEVRKDDPAITERLIETFVIGPHLLYSEGDYYFLWRYKDKLYVIGSLESSVKFNENPLLAQ